MARNCINMYVTLLGLECKVFKETIKITVTKTDIVMKLHHILEIALRFEVKKMISNKQIILNRQ